MSIRSLKINILLLFCFASNAQSQLPFNNKYAGKKVTTIIEYQGKPDVIATDKDGTVESMSSDEYAKKDRQTWTSGIEIINGQTILTRTLERLEVTAPGPSGIERYDSDNVAESTDGAEAFVTSKLKSLKKTVTYTSGKAGWKTEDAFSNEIESIWNDNLPVIGRDGTLQSIYFSPILPDKMNEGFSWKETILISNSEIENTYTIENKTERMLTIHLLSKQVYSNKTQIDPSQKGNIRTGAIQFMSSKKKPTMISKNFNGRMLVDQTNSLISEMNLNVSAILNSTSSNTNAPKTKILTVKVTNRL
jgi:hypothetical protein